MIKRKKKMLIVLTIVLVILLSLFKLLDNDPLTRDENVTLSDIYGEELERLFADDEEYVKEMLSINLHRSDKKDLEKLLKPYKKHKNFSLYPNPYELRRKIRSFDKYAEKFNIPKIPNRNSKENKRIKEAIRDGDYAVKYTYIYSDPDLYLDIFVEIDSSGKYYASLIDDDYLQFIAEGTFNVERVEDTLIDAVNYGFFDLPYSVSDDLVEDGSVKEYEITINNTTYIIGGVHREVVDDVFYKVDGMFKKIFHTEININ